MSSSNSSMAYIADDIARMVTFNQVWGIFIFTFGVIGHTLNIYAFTRRPFRSNPCARYFLAASISGCLVVYMLVPLRLLQIGYYIDVFISSVLACQILSYLLAWFRIIPSWFIVLASFDRFLCSSSSVNLRGWSSSRVASYSIPVVILFTGLLYIHVPFNQGILTAPQRSCTFTTSAYRAFFSIYNLIVWSWLPSILMLSFGLLTIRHIRQGRRRIAQQNVGQKNQKKIDRQLIQMLVLQCFVFTSTTTVGSACQLYVSLANNIPGQSALERTRNQYIGNTGNTIAITGPCISFYLFTLSSQMFRHEVMNLFRKRQAVQGSVQTNTAHRQTIEIPLK